MRQDSEWKGEQQIERPIISDDYQFAVLHTPIQRTKPLAKPRTFDDLSDVVSNSDGEPDEIKSIEVPSDTFEIAKPVASAENLHGEVTNPEAEIVGSLENSHDEVSDATSEQVNSTEYSSVHESSDRISKQSSVD